MVVYVYELTLIARNIVLSEDSDYGANRLACSAVYAFIWIDEVLIVVVGCIDTVHRTYIYASTVFNVNTRLADDVSHS